MVGELFINGLDAQEEWGIIFASGSFTALLTPPPVKAYIENKSALMHGKQVLSGEDNPPKMDERDVQLTFYIRAKSMTDFLTKYDRFCKDVLQKGHIDIRTKYQPKVVYHCNYLSCGQFSQFNGRLAKFVLKLNEPDPNNRTDNYA